MKFLKLFVFNLFVSVILLPVNSFAKNTVKELDLDSILKLQDKTEIHRSLLRLKKKNLAFNKTILKESSYRPAVYNFSNTLEIILDRIPAKLALIPNCKELKIAMASDYKVEWEQLEEPTHKLWPAIEKLCSKTSK